MDNSQQRFYELEYPVPAVNSSPNSSAEGDKGATLIVALHGYADAGQAVETSANHLKAALEHRLIASFETDELIDYRSRRPAVTIAEDEDLQIENFDIEMSVLRDPSGKAFLLLSGPEPDLRWRGFTEAVTDLAQKFKVDNTICLYAAPMPTPHTRPMVVTAHGNSQKLVGHMLRMDSTMMVPGAASLFIERALAKAGSNVAGYTAHVPHYLGASGYPQATLGLLESISHTLGLKIPLKSLERDVERFNQQLETQVMDSEEIIEVIQQLEEQYDRYMERYRQEHPQAIMPGEAALPTADELSAEFEKFLDAVGHEESWRAQILSEDINDREDAIGAPGPAASDNNVADTTDSVDPADAADAAEDPTADDAEGSPGAGS
ncbi:PAC2 family protein [Corynebacterium lizhenjunii]|uniref:PAC2 family protein n=1 Tax=Corynebacterium lizhenjunii TaxID=2709394 RepID=A0A7T0KCN1_9CORY|nr:PAC2 family protein [Corynebacterium lizhenjunii]QPK78336.1 PAC2 family protein [Corynebacterium lizhenjunii]